MRSSYIKSPENVGDQDLQTQVKSMYAVVVLSLAVVDSSSVQYKGERLWLPLHSRNSRGSRVASRYVIGLQNIRALLFSSMASLPGRDCTFDLRTYLSFAPKPARTVWTSSSLSIVRDLTAFLPDFWPKSSFRR